MADQLLHGPRRRRHRAGEATAQQDALAKLTTDLTYRIDLGNDGAINFRNYGGAATASQDNTNYKSVTSSNGTVPRVTTTGMETVNTTGLGAVDYKAAGSNTPDLVFSNQQNYFGLNTAVDLRGNGVDNVLLANNGNDALEGRGGDDVLSGGAGDDRFVAAFGDGVDWVARPVDANGDNLWDTTGGLVVAGGLAWGQDFRPAAAATAGTTTLVVDFGTTVLNEFETFVATFQVRIDGVDYGTAIPVATLAVAKNTAELAAIVNPIYQAISSSVSVVATSATTLEVRAVDTTPADGKLPVIGTTALEGFFISGQASGVGTFQAKGSILGSEGTNLEDDRLVIKSYEDRSINLGLDQTKFETSQAAAMVANFTEGGSQLVETQGNRLYLSNVREGDTVSVTINGAVYSYTLKAGERADQAATGLANAVNRFLDVNSSSGRVVAAADMRQFRRCAEAAAGGRPGGRADHASQCAELHDLHGAQRDGDACRRCRAVRLGGHAQPVEYRSADARLRRPQRRPVLAGCNAVARGAVPGPQCRHDDQFAAAHRQECRRRAQRHGRLAERCRRRLHQR